MVSKPAAMQRAGAQMSMKLINSFVGSGLVNDHPNSVEGEGKESVTQMPDTCTKEMAVPPPSNFNDLHKSAGRVWHDDADFYSLPQTLTHWAHGLLMLPFCRQVMMFQEHTHLQSVQAVCRHLQRKRLGPPRGRPKVCESRMPHWIVVHCGGAASASRTSMQSS